MNPQSSPERPRSPSVGVPLRRAKLADVLQGSSISPAVFLAGFQRTTDADVLEMTQACHAADAPRVRELAHRIEGAALVIGAEPFAAACAALAAASSGSAAVLQRELDTLLSHKQVLYTWIRARHPLPPT